MLRGQTNGDHNALEILHHIFISKPEHTISARREPFITPVIVAQAGFEIVALAINLNHELAGMRDEVRNVIAHGALSAKAEPGQSICLQMTPQQSFCASHRAS